MRLLLIAVAIALSSLAMPMIGYELGGAHMAGRAGYILVLIHYVIRKERLL